MDERVTPEMALQYHISRLGITIDDLGVAPIVVVSWIPELVEGLADRFAAERATYWPRQTRHPLLTGEAGGRKVSLVLLPVGAAGTVTVLEKLIACGARTIIGLGYTGSLQPSMPVGTLVIPTSCVRDEGTSPHYVKDVERIVPDEGLVRSLRRAAEAVGVEAAEGCLWTTDAPYRELVSTIDAHQRQGVVGVDMETSAMYALGQYRGIRVANLLVVSDEVWQEWRPAFGTDELTDAAITAQDVVAHCISSGLT